MDLISECELDVRLAGADPVDADALRADAAISTALDGVLAQVVARQPPAKSGGGSPQRRLPRRRGSLVAAGAVVIAGVAVLIGASVGGPGRRSVGGLSLAVPAAQAAELDKLAHAASATTAPSGDEYVYEQLLAQGNAAPIIAGHRVSYSYELPLRLWIPGDAKSLRSPTRSADHVRIGPGSTLTPSNPSDAAYTTGRYRSFLASVASVQATDTVVGGPGGLTLSQQAALPTNPTALLDALKPYVEASETPIVVAMRESLEPLNRKRHLHWIAAQITQMIERRLHLIELTTQPLSLIDGLRSILETSTSPQLRSAAFQAMKYVPHIKVLGRRTDSRGRTGIAIEDTESSNSFEVMIVDPESGSLLQDTVTISRVNPHESTPGPVGFLIGQVTWLKTAVVSRVGDA
jgi:hypothetical protein